MMSNISQMFVDTNILIFYTNSFMPQHSQALQTIDQMRQTGIDLVISPQILREYLAAGTKFISAGHQITLTRIRENFQAFQSEFRVVNDDRQVLAALDKLLQNVPVAGKQI
jgi:predicted nucleic acid-binding protein